MEARVIVWRDLVLPRPRRADPPPTKWRGDVVDDLGEVLFVVWPALDTWREVVSACMAWAYDNGHKVGGAFIREDAAGHYTLREVTRTMKKKRPPSGGQGGAVS